MNKLATQIFRYFFTRLGGCCLALFVGFAFPYGVSALEPESGLPIYRTEEIAAPKLEAGLRAAAEKSGVEVHKYLPLPPEEVRKMVGVGAKVQAGGKADQLLAFLEAVGSRDGFHNISQLSIRVDRKNPEMMNAAFRVSAWYAKNEKVSGKVKKWERSLGSTKSVMEVYTVCSALLEGEAVRFAGFDLEGKTIRLAGEGKSSADANGFGGRLFNSKNLGDWDWTWEMRPRVNAKAKDGMVEFRIVGNSKVAASGKSKGLKSKQK